MATRTTALEPPRWLVVTAWAAFLATVPSAVWRVLMILGLLPGTAELRALELGDSHAVSYAYVFGLSIVQLSTGFLTVGLVRPWGERFAGRWVPVLPVVTVATLGGLAVVWLFDVSMVRALLAGVRPDQGSVDGGALVLMVACYLPIFAWGPLELVATWGYWRRRVTLGSSSAMASSSASRSSSESASSAAGGVRRA